MQKTRIFLTEDDDDDKEFFRLALSNVKADTELTIFDNGEDLLNFLTGNCSLPDLIFLDINMPRINGVECLKQIKHIFPDPAFRIVMLSTAAPSKIISDCYTYGANAYIQKPSQLSLLSTYISHCIHTPDLSGKNEEFIINNAARNS